MDLGWRSKGFRVNSVQGCKLDQLLKRDPSAPLVNPGPLVHPGLHAEGLACYGFGCEGVSDLGLGLVVGRLAAGLCLDALWPCASFKEHAETAPCFFFNPLPLVLCLRLHRCVQIIVNRLPVSKRRLRRMRMFFMTESLALRKTAQQMRKNTIVSPIVPRHVAFQPKSEAERRQNVWDTAMDWLLFSMCQYHMIDKSGFSKTAMAYSLTRKALYTNPRLRFWSPGLGRCDGKIPDKIEGVGAFWSGL